MYFRNINQKLMSGGIMFVYKQYIKNKKTPLIKLSGVFYVITSSWGEVTPLALEARELAGSNPAYSTVMVENVGFFARLWLLCTWVQFPSITNYFCSIMVIQLVLTQLILVQFQTKVQKNIKIFAYLK